MKSFSLRLTFLSSMVLLTAPNFAKALQCRQLFEGSGRLQLVEATNANQVIHPSGNQISIGQEKPIFSRDQDKFALWDSKAKWLYIYSGAKFSRTELKLPIDHVVDFREDLIIGQNKTENAFFIIDAITGSVLHKIEDSHVFFKDSQSGSLNFITYPKINGFRDGQGRIERVQVDTLKSGAVLSETIIFDSYQEDFVGDFVKIKQGGKHFAVHKNNFVMISLQNDFQSLTKIFSETGNYYYVRSETRLQIFNSSGELALDQSIQPDNETRFIGYSKKVKAFIAFDLKAKRLIGFQPLSDGTNSIQLGPRMRIGETDPKMTGDDQVSFLSSDKIESVWTPSTDHVKPK